METLIWLRNETDVWIELTTLLIPDENDSDEEIKNECDWILKNLGENVPLHFTAFHPDFKMMNKIAHSTFNFNSSKKYCRTNLELSIVMLEM